MNADEVCAMIDAITDGRNWTMLVNDAESMDVLGVQAIPEGVLFDQGTGHRVLVVDPREVREIAGLLVAWANAKERTTPS